MLTSIETIRLIRDGKVGGGGGVGMEGGKRLYTYRYTVTTRMTHALRRAAMRAIVIFHIIVRQKFTRECRQTTTFEKKESRSGFEPRPLRLPALPLGQTGSTITKLAITLNRSCAPRWRKFTQGSRPDRKILEEGSGAGPSHLPRRYHE